MNKPVIFSKVKSLVKKYSKNMDVRSNTDINYGLYGKKTVTAYNKEVEGMYFASAVVNKNFIGFYFFPIYTHPQEFDNVPPELKKCLKGKSCFHIKVEDEVLMAQINDLLDQGYKLYKREGWL